MKIYTDFTNGKITKDIFQQKKESISDTVARKRIEIENCTKQLQTFFDERGKIETALTELKPFRGIEMLDREIITLLIDKILIHNENDIEIVWHGKFSDE